MSERILPISSRKFIKVLLRFGFKIRKRKATDHIVLTKEGCARPLIVPDRKSLPVFIILNNLRSAKISRKDYLKKLKRK